MDLFWLVVSIGMLFLLARWFGGMGVGAPWLPVRKQDIEAALDLVVINPSDVVIDLGSGDGRLLFAAAEKGASVIGYELNPFMVWLSRRRLKRFGTRAVIHRKNLLEADLSRATVIYIFGIDSIMPKIVAKLLHEAPRDARIISFAFALDGLNEIGKRGIARLYTLPIDKIG
jgi:16S rRNA A1518/A1519 N6-dimethyltransferase RsmA/KsgA/DIM1 with predicted DNA glycosylase/AP lyase activity